jgi:hypothetical protein
VQFDGPHPMGNAGMRVEIYEISLVRGGGDRLDTLHRLVHNQYINIPPKESLLTRVVNSCDKESAETIAYVLFHRYVIEPSLEAVEPHWLKTFAPHLWECKRGVPAARERMFGGARVVTLRRVADSAVRRVPDRGEKEQQQTWQK